MIFTEERQKIVQEHRLHSHLGECLSAVSFLHEGHHHDLIFLDGYPIWYRDLMVITSKFLYMKGFDFLPHLEQASKAISRLHADLSIPMRDLLDGTKVAGHGHDGIDISDLPQSDMMYVLWVILIKLEVVKYQGDIRPFLREVSELVMEARKNPFS